MFLKGFKTEKPTFSVKIIKSNPSGCGICIGVGLDTSHWNGSICNGAFYLENFEYKIFENQNLAYKKNENIKDNSVVTVNVDLNTKEISYKVDGVPVGPPRKLNISDEDMKKLRPLVEMECVDNTVEAVP